MHRRHRTVHLEAIRKAPEGRQNVAWGESPRTLADAPTTVPLQAIRKAPKGRQNVASGVSPCPYHHFHHAKSDMPMMASAPRIMVCSLSQPRQIVIQPGSPS